MQAYMTVFDGESVLLEGVLKNGAFGEELANGYSGLGDRAPDVEGDDYAVVFVLATHSINDVVGEQGDVIASPEGGVCVAQGDGLLHEAEQVMVPVFLVPNKGGAIQGIFASAHAYLVTVVDARRTGKGHLHHSGEPERRLVASSHGY